MEATKYSTVAQDNATVGTQVGVVHGNATFYSVSSNATPAEKYQVGLNYLNGNVPRKAEELIHEAVINHYRNAEVAYYWSLSLLSGRTFDHLDDDDFDKLNSAFRMANDESGAGSGQHGWRTAVEVVVRLVECLAAQESMSDNNGSGFYQVLKLYEGLPDARRDEIRRHLDMVLAGGIQDLIDETDASAIETARFDRNRRTRAPKFFIAPPAEPRMRIGMAQSDAHVEGRLRTAGLVPLAIGAAAVLYILITRNPLALIPVAALAATSGYLIARFGPTLTELTAMREHDRSRRHVASTQSDRENATPDEKEFRENLRLLVDATFDNHRPTEVNRDIWRRETAKLRVSVIAELTAQYNWSRSKFAPWDIDWLVDWHARRAADRWRKQREVTPTPRQVVIPTTVRAGYTAGLTAGSCAALVAVVASLLISDFWPAGLIGLFGAGPLVYGGVTFSPDVFERSVRRRRVELDNEDRQRQFAAEDRAYRKWKHGLEDRPTDAEMARWLDHDKAYIKNVAMRHFGLRNRDLIGHVTLTSSGSACARARVLYGPPRYSTYQVRVFLLTERGVREVNMHLDFATGAVLNPFRTVFRYEAITSAEVGEVSVRFDGGERKVERVDDNVSRVPAQRGNGQRKFTLAQALHLTLNNGRSTFVLIENFDLGLIDRMREDSAYLDELARDAAGVNGALRILEAIAAEGAHWVEQERGRRNRRIQHYQERQRRRKNQLGPGPTINLGPELPGPEKP